MSENAHPFLKWAGGKRWLAHSDAFAMPNDSRQYYEPFLGGGAVFFSSAPRSARLSDVNLDLINAYKAVRDDLPAVQKLLARHQACHNEEYYYKVREQSGGIGIDAAASFIYLNRTCWNGLYRVNRNGRFNVPIGTKTRVVFEDGELERVSLALSNAELHCCDFEDALKTVREKDFVFIDPPYTANHNMNGFLKYNERIFSWKDQIRLRDTVSSIVEQGAYVVVTNADHESVRTLYEGVGQYRQEWRASVLSGDGSKRGRTSEALFIANFE